jgi:hypothetical protein
MEKESKVPKEVGICVDNSGSLGLLYLNVPREVEGTKEFLALVKDHYTNSYQVEFHENENLEGETFHLHKADEPLPGEIYYITDADVFDEVGNIEFYALYLDYEEYVRFNVALEHALPGITLERYRWKNYYHVVRVLPD